MQRFLAGVGTSTLGQSLSGRTRGGRPPRMRHRAGIPKSVSRVPIVEELSFGWLGTQPDLSRSVEKFWGRLNMTRGFSKGPHFWAVCDAGGKVVDSGTLPGSNFIFQMKPGFRRCRWEPVETTAAVPSGATAVQTVRPVPGVTSAVPSTGLPVQRLSPSAQDAVDEMKAKMGPDKGISTTTILLIGGGVVAAAGLAFLFLRKR